MLKSPFSERADGSGDPVVPNLQNVLDLYFNGNMDASFAFGGQVAGRIESVEPVRDIIERTMDEFNATVADVQTWAP